MPRIRLVAFDLDNTLWDVEVVQRAEQRLRAWLAAEAPAAAACYSEQGDLRQLYLDLIKQQPQLGHDISGLRRAVLHQVFLRSGTPPEAARTLSERAFEVLLEARHAVEFYPGTLAVLSSMARRYTLGSLTNGNADPRRIGLDRYFSFCFCAADVGARKPAPDLFERALDHQGVAAEESVYVGDHPVDDIGAAAAVGMHTVWINGPIQRARRQETNVRPPASAEIETLQDLPAAIARIEAG